jgi:hypothetical protein
MNKVCHGEKQSDVAIQLEFQMDCRVPPAGLAMTNSELHEQNSDLFLRSPDANLIAGM